MTTLARLTHLSWRLTTVQNACILNLHVSVFVNYLFRVLKVYLSDKVIYVYVFERATHHSGRQTTVPEKMLVHSICQIMMMNDGLHCF